MFSQGYTNQDLEQLTKKARTLWEYDVESSPKKIKRRPNVISDSVPLQAIYRMVVEDWREGKFNRYHFPFATTSNFARILGLNDGWEIPAADRKHIEKDMVLVASDGKTILILPEPTRRWWETTWFNASSLLLGIFGIVFGLFKCSS